MSIRTFNHDAADKLGKPVTSGGSYPAECWNETYIGAVLDTYERNGYDDSDFLAIVWDEAEQCVKDVEYATTRGWTYLNSAAVDATDEVKAKAAAYWRARHRESLEIGTRRKFAKPHVNCRVKVVRGRKVPKGFEGIVRNVSERYNPYDRRPSAKKQAWILVVADDGSSWEVLADYCEMIPDTVAVESAVAAELEKFDAIQYPANMSWRSAPYQALYYAGVDVSNMRV